MTTRVAAAIYFVIMAGIFIITSIRGHQQSRNYTDYSLAGRAIGGLVNGMGGMASYLSAFLFMGMTGAVWSIGFPYIGVLVPFSLSIAMFMALIGPYARKTGGHTLIEFLELRYGKSAATIALVINILFVAMFMVGQMKALGICIEYITGFNYSLAILVGGVILTVYCVIGGMRGITWNQFVQGLVMLVGIMVPLAFVFRELNVADWWNPLFGYRELSSTMADRGFFELQKSPLYYISLILPGLGGAAAAPQVFAISARAKNADSARWGISWMVLLVGIVYACAMAFAFAATYWAQSIGFVVEPGRADYLLFDMVERILPAPMGALVVAGALAASFSTAAVLIAFCGQVAVNNVVVPLRKTLLHKHNDLPDKSRIQVMAWTIGIVGVLCIVLSWSPPALLVAPIMWGWELLTCTLLVPAFFACWWKRATKWGTIASMLVGCLVVLTQGWTGPVISFPFYGSLVFLPLALLTNIVVSLLTPVDAQSSLVDGWHGLVGGQHSSGSRYNSKALPLLLAGASICLLVLVYCN